MSDVNSIIRPGDKVVFTTRRHWVNIIPGMAAWTFMASLSLYGFYIVGRYPGAVESVGSIVLVLVGLTAMMALALLFAYSSYKIYDQNQLILTNHSVYLITQTTLFGRRVDQFELDRLQEVTSTQNGFFAYNLNYGEVIAETAGDEKNLHFHQAPDPRRIAAIISERHEQAEAARPPQP